ncbi:MAG: hypothetical protein HOY78_46060 [Saccharothrix sp.]|nr:hypothetical protein [Saccharothrix sp.]
MTFNSLGDLDRVRRLADGAGVALTRLSSSTRRLAGEDVTYNVFEIAR